MSTRDTGMVLEDPHFWFDPLRVKLAAVNDLGASLSDPRS